jgi:coenzyme F420-reducing hydrogenase alpha subunit
VKDRQINVGYVTRVEGQGEIEIRVSEGQIREARFPIFEPPKFFESFLVGRHCSEVHELTSRICGICPVPHQITALRAVENAMGIEVSEQTRDLRRLLNYSSHLQSHILSIYILSLPDFLGHESIFTMTKDYAVIVLRALKLKKL